MQLNQISYNMGRKFKLLPHWCQIAGYTYILGLLLCFACALVYTMGIFPEDCGIINGINSIHKHALTHWNFVGALNFVMIFLAIFSKEKVEDEMVRQLRLNSLLVALYINYAVLIVCSLFVYGLDFLYVMIYNMFTILLIFMVVFRYRMWRLNKEMKDEEQD